MKILCLGSFLAEGLEKLGHEVIRARLDPGRPMREQVETVCVGARAKMPNLKA